MPVFHSLMRVNESLTSRELGILLTNIITWIIHTLNLDHQCQQELKDLCSAIRKLSQQTQVDTDLQVLKAQLGPRLGHLSLDPPYLSTEQKRGRGLSTVHPYCTGKVCWDTTCMMLVLIESILLPFDMAFLSSKDKGPAWTVWFWVATCFFFFDIFLTFNTSFVRLGPKKKDLQVVTSRQKIAIKYLTGWFFLDFISTVPWYKVLAYSEVDSETISNARLLKIAKITKLLKLTRLLRMLRLLKIQVVFEKIEVKLAETLGSSQVIHLVQLVIVLLQIIFVCHWNACLWWYIGNPSSVEYLKKEVSGLDNLDSTLYEEENKRHWSTTYVLHSTLMTDGSVVNQDWRWIDQPIREIYSFCFYWSLGVMRTMPTEIYPVNFVERLYVMTYMFFGFSIFSICVTRITTLVSKISYRRATFKQDMAHFREWLYHNKISKNLQTRVNTYLEHLFFKQRFSIEETRLLSTLSPGLDCELKAEQFGPILRGVPIFHRLSAGEMGKLSKHCTRINLSPGDILTEKGCQASGAWVLYEGHLCVSEIPQFSSRNSVCQGRLGSQHSQGGSAGNAMVISAANGCVHGIDMDILMQPRASLSSHTVWSADFAELLYLDHHSFQTLLWGLPPLREKLNTYLEAHRPQDSPEDAEGFAEESSGPSFCGPSHHSWLPRSSTYLGQPWEAGRRSVLQAGRHFSFGSAYNQFLRRRRRKPERLRENEDLSNQFLLN